MSENKPIILFSDGELAQARILGAAAAPRCHGAGTPSAVGLTPRPTRPWSRADSSTSMSTDWLVALPGEGWDGTGALVEPFGLMVLPLGRGEPLVVVLRRRGGLRGAAGLRRRPPPVATLWPGASCSWPSPLRSSCQVRGAVWQQLACQSLRSPLGGATTALLAVWQQW